MVPISSIETERDVFEEKLRSRFDEHVIPVEQVGNLINDFKDGSFHMSQMGMMLYTNGNNARSKSTNYPHGLVYHKNGVLFGVGYFGKETKNTSHLHLVAPKGGDQLVRTVRSFVDALRMNEMATNAVYVRSLTQDQYDSFRVAGFDDIDSDPWHPGAPKEDDTYPDRVYTLKDLFELGHDGMYTVKTLPSSKYSGGRRKNRNAYNRFEGFMSRNGASVSFQDYIFSPEEAEIANRIVTSHFEFLAKRQVQGARGAAMVIGSSSADYKSLIEQRPYGESGRDYHALLGTLHCNNESIPISLFQGESIGDDRVALYTSISLRFREQFSAAFDGEGFSAIAQYMQLEVLKILAQRGVAHVHSGGSEIESLDTMKKQMGGSPIESQWVVLPATT